MAHKAQAKQSSGARSIYELIAITNVKQTFDHRVDYKKYIPLAKSKGVIFLSRR